MKFWQSKNEVKVNDADFISNIWSIWMVLDYKRGIEVKNQKEDNISDYL